MTTTSNAYNTGKIFDGYMGRNIIINGSCVIAQRASVAVTTSANTYGGPDRYTAINNSGGQFTQSQGTITYNGISKNAVVQTVNTAITTTASTNYWSGILQFIEGLNCYYLIGQPFTVSFIFNTNVTGTFSVALRDGTAANSYITTFSAVANTPTKIIVQVPANSSLVMPISVNPGLAVWIGALNTGTYQTSGLNMWQSGSFISGSGLTNWGSTASNFIAVTELQIEEGAIATPFERESVSITQNKCLRYFNNFGGTTPHLTGVVTTATTTGRVGCSLPVPMRIAPTVTLVLTPSIYDGATIEALVSIAANYSTAIHLEMDLTTASGFTTPGRAAVLYMGQSGGFNVSAEF